jgi:predicted DCC family thiol-disulfide oxidoreductase YuxK
LTLLDSSNDTFVVIYDGDCPFCRSYVAYSALSQRFARLDLIDARTDPELQLTYRSLGYDLNEGMVVIENGLIFHGSRAMERIAYHTRGNRRGNALLARVMFDSRTAEKLYGVLSVGRSIVLKILRRTKL